jgi:hypothetical protein
MKNYNTNNVESFANLTFYPMTAPNIGCIATGKLCSGLDITVTGGNMGQHADGIEMFLVEVSDKRDEKNEPRIVTKRNMNSDEISLLIEHHFRNRFRRQRNSWTNKNRK